MIALLAFTPLYDPLPSLYPGMNEAWLLFVFPLVIAISVVYKATRVATVSALPREAAIMTLQILLIMVLAAVLLAGGTWAYLRLGGTFH